MRTALVLALALALASTLALVVACAPSPQATASPAPAAATTAIPTASPAAGMPFATWTRIDIPDPAPNAFVGTRLRGVVPLGNGFLAIGSIGSCCDGPNPDVDHGVTWTSVDGRSWTLREHNPTFDHALLDGIAADGVRLVVTGRAAARGADDGTLAGAVWVSKDGETWTRSAEPVPTEVLVGASRLIGAVQADAIEVGSRIRFYVSGDGLGWALTGTYAADLRAWAAAEDGSAMALGTRPGTSRADGTSTTDVVAWWTADGAMWAGPQVIAHDAHPVSLVAHDGAFVAIAWAPLALPDGSIEDDWQVWQLAADGSRTSARIPIAVGESLGLLSSIGDALIASGTTVVDGAQSLMVWVSTDDGRTWGRVPVQDGFNAVEDEIYGMLETPGGLLAIGSRLDLGKGHHVPVVWVSAR